LPRSVSQAISSIGHYKRIDRTDEITQLLLKTRNQAMTISTNMPSRKTIILVGLVGCFLTSVAGVTGSMLISGWVNSGGWLEWSKRLALGYPCACFVVLGIFPVLVPWLTQRLEGPKEEQEQIPW
jgi:hypothetical protein